MIINNCFFNQRILIAYPSVPIKTSWLDEFNILKREDKVNFTTFLSLKNHIDKEYDLIIVDECHKLSSKQTENIKKIKGKKIYMSGTISDKTKFNLSYNLKAPIIINYDINDAINDGIISDFEIHVFKTELEQELLLPYKQLSWKIDAIKYDFTKAGLLKMLSLNRMRMLHRSVNKMKLLKQLVDKVKEKRFLIFTTETLLSDQLEVPAYHSKNKDEQLKEDFCTGKGNGLVVLKMFNQGVTIKPINLCIIHNFTSNPEELAQQLNRVTAYEYGNENKKATIVITCLKNTQEEIWLSKGLSFIPKNKIFYHE